MRSQFTLILSTLALAGCGERVPQNDSGQGSTTPPYVRTESRPLAADRAQPVRIGEMGANFAACNARGTTRDRFSGGPVAVRAAPYEQDEAIDRLQPGADFFICSRTHDQRWFGIVYDEGGRAAERCGVTRPAPAAVNYRGPCAAGWVASAEVRLEPGTRIEAPPSD